MIATKYLDVVLTIEKGLECIEFQILESSKSRGSVRTTSHLSVMLRLGRTKSSSIFTHYGTDCLESGYRMRSKLIQY